MGFLNLSTLDILGQVILPRGEGGCSVQCRVFCSIPVVYPLDASSVPHPQCDNQHCQMLLRGGRVGKGGVAISPPIENHSFKGSHPPKQDILVL